jgi:hypothetical protein
LVLLKIREESEKAKAKRKKRNSVKDVVTNGKAEAISTPSHWRNLTQMPNPPEAAISRVHSTPFLYDAILRNETGVLRFTAEARGGTGRVSEEMMLPSAMGPFSG